MISAAMIVRNEEKNLARCLKSIKGIVDEIIVVDTGSIDKTVEIAQSFGAKIFHESWENNFAKHRNTSLSHCTHDWILQIDADEEFFLEGITAEELKDFLSKMKPDTNAIAMTLKDWSDKIQTFAGEVDIPRIFRRGHVSFKRKIHNEPVYTGVTGFLSYIWIKHYGYNLTIEEQQVKAKRTIGLLMESIAETPDDHVLYFYLAQAQLKFGENTDAAIISALEYFSRKDRIGKNEFNASIIHLIASVYIRQRKYVEAAKFITGGLRENPNDVDLSWDLMTLGIETKNNGLTLTGAAQYVKAMSVFTKTRSENGMIGNQFYFHIDPHSQSAANYWFAILQIESGITTMRNLIEFSEKHCKPYVHEEIKSRMKEDLRRLDIVDRQESRIITTANFGAAGGNRHHRSVGGRR